MQPNIGHDDGHIKFIQPSILLFLCGLCEIQFMYFVQIKYMLLYFQILDFA